MRIYIRYELQTRCCDMVWCGKKGVLDVGGKENFGFGFGVENIVGGKQEEAGMYPHYLVNKACVRASS
jgi:hypothetical protein